MSIPPQIIERMAMGANRTVWTVLSEPEREDCRRWARESILAIPGLAEMIEAAMEYRGTGAPDWQDQELQVLQAAYELSRANGDDT